MFHQQLDICAFFPVYHQVEVKKFLSWLLQDAKLDPNVMVGNKLPLDAALIFSWPKKTDKAEILCLLLQHGAKITLCTYSKEIDTTFLSIATLLAIEIGMVC